MANSKNEDFDSRKLIHKIANNRVIIAFHDLTNDTWKKERRDNEGNRVRNNVQIRFIRYNSNNKAEEYIPVFVNADELMAVMNSIRMGNFSKAISPYKNYGGSNSGISWKAENDNKVSIIKGVESRIFSMYINNSKLNLVAECFKGTKMDKGAIKKTGEAEGNIYIALDTVRALTMAEAVHSYLIARKSMCIFNEEMQKRYDKHKEYMNDYDKNNNK